MKHKEGIEILLKSLKLLGHERDKIEDRLGYSPNAIDQSLSRGGSKKLLNGIQLYKDWVLLNSISNSQPEGQSPPVIQGDVLTDLEELKKLVDRIGKKIQEERTSERGKSLKAQANRDLNKGSVKSRSTSGRDRLEKDSSSGG